MRPRRSLMAAAAALLLVVVLAPPHGWAADYVYSYWLLDQPDGSTRYRLTVSVTTALYEYYSSRNHNLPLTELARFVTPNALEPIADNLWKIHRNQEDFANGVLMILHQIAYVESDPKYPVETIVQNQGDCDTFSYMAASILMAGGLDVVLFYYESKSHMNVGVRLSQTPQDARSAVYYYTHEGARYYVAECTGGNWQNGWRVGECPEDFEGVSARIISLEDCEQQFPGQVAASYDSPTASALSLTLSSTYVIQSGAVTISGSISPALSNRNVTIYVRGYGATWNVLKTVVTDANGEYSYWWKPSSAGMYQVRAGWSGDSEYTGADTSISTLIVLSTYWLILGITTLALISAAIIITLLGRQTRPLAEPQDEDFNL